MKYNPDDNIFYNDDGTKEYCYVSYAEDSHGNGFSTEHIHGVHRAMACVYKKERLADVNLSDFNGVQFVSFLDGPLGKSGYDQSYETFSND